jgi:hypothetical protein
MGGLGQGRPKIIKRVKTRSPAFRRSEFSELQNLKFSHIFFKFCARRFFFLKEWKFSGFGRKLLQSLRAESGAERKPFLKIFLEKSSSLSVKAAHNLKDARRGVF